jgi:thymidylate synthase (FAD)
MIPFGEWRKQSKSSKQGSEGVLNEEGQSEAHYIQEEVVELCKESYSKLLELGVSKEQARSVLPLALETEFIWTGSFLAFMHMCNLRLKPDTQKETRDIVEAMMYLVKNNTDGKFKHSLNAYGFES